MVPRPRPDDPRPSRREVLAGAAAIALGLGGARGIAAGEEEPPPLPRRALGGTGFESTLVGLGCFSLGSLPDDDVAVGVITRALDHGCNYLDTAPSYASGRSESRVAKALAARPEAKVFLATKTHTRTAADARRDLEGSLGRLGVSRIDLVQVHAVKDDADLDRVLADDGPLAALRKAREEGLVRFIGCTGHADPVVMRRAVETGAFDSILCPLNCVDPHHLSFEKDTLPAAVKRGMARIAMKAFASGKLVERGIDPEACLRYVLGLDVSTIIVGCRSVEEVDLAVRVARENRPLDGEAKQALLKSTHPLSGKPVEWYKRA